MSLAFCRSTRVAAAICIALTMACGDDGEDATTDAATSAPGTSSDDGTPATSSGSESGPAPTSSSGVADSGDTSQPGDSTGADTSGDTSGGSEQDLDMTPEDFVCVLEWDQVRRFRVTNLLGHLEQTLEVANSPDGGMYPVGTVIQLIPNEAMVKRANGWSPETNDWEFFSLSTSEEGTEILDRGATEVVNQFGGNCFGCHSAAEPQWDLICEQDHGCDPLPIGKGTIEALQQNDPRCR